MHWMLMPYRRYADFSGRSRRMEFWMFQLFNVIVSVVLYAFILGGGGLDMLTAAADPNLGAGIGDVSFGPLFWIGVVLLGVWGLATIIPSLAVTVRRLHDRNMSGWYLVGFIAVVIVLTFIPLIGPLVTIALEIGWIVLLALPGTPGPNNYGPDPLGQADTATFA